ncbi:hypothetical protein D5086_002642 [Populus alba]|uniref:Uncharacterized protein n=1 Tax=Populus alba TaxID=43335 RepID=A0ACC4D402_POPAL|nr:transcription factor bHLH113-like isoform X1 [Populus alba]
MAGRESFFEGNHLVPEGNPPSFSELLFSNDDDDFAGVDVAHAFHFSSVEKSPTMLCFGGYNYRNESEIVMFSEETKTTPLPQISGVTCSDSSSASSCNNNCNSVNVISTISKSNRKRNGSSQEVPMKCTNTVAKTPLLSQRNSKRTETKNPGSTANAKVKREKLGDRIAALQELVSPFGKTDTASVLHEAMGYIRFLQDQVKVLCTPYLQNLPEGGEKGGEESTKNLRSRGLCLVSVDCTLPVANSNGADFWSPATMGN